jgi:hypothetical protein
LGEVVPATLVGATGISLNMANFVNRIYHQIELMKEWWWLEKQARIRLFAAYDTGTVTTTDGSATVVGVGTDWVTAAVAAKDYFKLDSEQHFYELQTVTDATNIDLTSNFIGANAAVGYDIVRIRYSTPSDFARVRDLIHAKSGRRLQGRSWERFNKIRTDRGRVIKVQDPTMYTVYAKDASNNREIWVDPAPKNASDLILSYVVEVTELANDADEPLVPPRYQEVFIDGVMTNHYKHIADDMQRAAISQQDTDFWVAKMINEQEEHEPDKIQFRVDMQEKRHQLHQALFGDINEATSRVWDSWP